MCSSRLLFEAQRIVCSSNLNRLAARQLFNGKRPDNCRRRANTVNLYHVWMPFLVVAPQRRITPSQCSADRCDFSSNNVSNNVTTESTFPFPISAGLYDFRPQLRRQNCCGDACELIPFPWLKFWGCLHTVVLNTLSGPFILTDEEASDTSGTTTLYLFSRRPLFSLSGSQWVTFLLSARVYL